MSVVREIFGVGSSQEAKNLLRQTLEELGLSPPKAADMKSYVDAKDAVDARAINAPDATQKILGNADWFCSRLFEVHFWCRSPLAGLDLREKTEWQIFYLLLLEEAVRTDTAIVACARRSIVTQFIEPVKADLVPRLNRVPTSNVSEWLDKLKIIAFLVVGIEDDDSRSWGEKNGKIRAEIENLSLSLRIARGS